MPAGSMRRSPPGLRSRRLRHDLVTLKAILLAQKSDEVVLARDFTAYVHYAPGGAAVEKLIVQCALDRTAVVYPPGRVDDKRLVRLDLVLVEEKDIRWVPRNPRELQAMRARQIGRNRGRLTQEKAK